MAEIREIGSDYCIAKQLYDAGNYLDAKHLLLRYVHERSDDPDGWKLLSECFWKLAQKVPEGNVEHRINYLHASMECLRRGMEMELEIIRKERLLRRGEENKIYGFTAYVPRRTFL